MDYNRRYALFQEMEATAYENPYSCRAVGLH
jgi:hypothetical protein